MTDDAKINLEVKSILLEEDPGGVYIKELHNDDEYDFEVAEISKMLKASSSDEQFSEEVSKYFSEIFGTTKLFHFKSIAKRIWDLKITE